ncbi:hypothetical protein CC79DRAFT_1367709 [Sarocladium strictum]
MEPLRESSPMARGNQIRRKPVGSQSNIAYVTVARRDGSDRRASSSDEVGTTESLTTQTLATLTGVPAPGEKGLSRGDRGAQQLWSSQLQRWLPECLWCVASIFIFGAIITVLAWRNNKPLPSWYANLTVNTVVALLATTCRAATIIPISEGISQLKWNWFATRTRPLQDLKVFDEASRGPWGSLRMVLMAKGHVFTTVAALVLTTGLATSTFTQSAIILETRQVSLPNCTAMCSRLRSTPDDYQPLWHDQHLSKFEDDMTRAAWQAMLGPLDKVSPPPTPPTCSTAECRWQSFTSLGVCMALNNASESLLVRTMNDEPEETYRASLFSDTYLEVTAPATFGMVQSGMKFALNITSPSMPRGDSEPGGYQERKYPRTTTFENEPDLLNTTLAHFSIIIFDLEDYFSASNFHAFELLWHFCTISHNWTVAEGQPVLVAQPHTAIVDSGGEYLHYANDTSYVTLGSADKRENFTVGRNNTYLYNMFAADYNVSINGWPSTPNDKVRDFIEARIAFNPSRKNFTEVSQEDRGRQFYNNLENMGESVAAGISNVLREYGEEVQGSALAPVVYIKVNWAWLSFIALQILFTIIFLIAVMIQTARLGVEVVKSSAMATLFAIQNDIALNSQDDPRSGLRRDVDKRVTGRLQRNENSWSVVVGEMEPVGK